MPENARTVDIELTPLVMPDDCGQSHGGGSVNIELEPVSCQYRAICVTGANDETGEPAQVKLFMQPEGRHALECMACIDIDSCESRDPAPLLCWEQGQMVACPATIEGGVAHIRITNIPHVPGVSQLEVIIYVDDHEFCPQWDPDNEPECAPFILTKLINDWGDEVIIPIPSQDRMLRPLCTAHFGFPAPDIREVRSGRIIVKGHFRQPQHGMDYVVIAAARFRTEYGADPSGDPLGDYSVQSSGCQFVVGSIGSCGDLDDDGDPDPPDPPDPPAEPPAGMMCVPTYIMCKRQPILWNGIWLYDCFDIKTDERIFLPAEGRYGVLFEMTCSGARTSCINLQDDLSWSESNIFFVHENRCMVLSGLGSSYMTKSQYVACTPLKTFMNASMWHPLSVMQKNWLNAGDAGYWQYDYNGDIQLVVMRCSYGSYASPLPPYYVEFSDINVPWCTGAGDGGCSLDFRYGGFYWLYHGEQNIPYYIYAYFWAHGDALASIEFFQWSASPGFLNPEFGTWLLGYYDDLWMICE